ncbi:undecaprenyl-phosphate glucose phosphotransferase [Leptospira bandrabouensis]|uniref:undecaprenyl-phosphate glucose phosphotransferase n=1 Tax=Leptospira bandrabouensis TaxID=2484903 RepID=UPI00223CCB6E|nr:undecaprenyl-phosphate glucose phosphotransferase [Leptospira bandrabouensis]MCW7459448.1 undecaprenyl-phosphate glucose phosphotransferase [Leptospira bandrabouensis]MCW7477885.1 undecaprenyl-phosphate glucose phosphotransferase [Leptospira bandrabouensis]MCW7485993.1 undecaprenyl-phosphate glucose phosphotransferase [Leptospira bandrabouensis]
MLKERSQSFKLLFLVTDFFIALTSFVCAYTIRYYFLPDSAFQIQTIDPINYIILGIVLGFSQVLSFLSIDLYHPRRGLSFSDELFAIITGVILNLLVVLSLLFFFRGESFSRLVIGYFAICTVILTSFSHYILRSFMQYLRSRGFNLKSVLVIGTGKSAINFAETIQKHSIYGYTVKGFAAGKKNLSPKKLKTVTNTVNLESYVKENNLDLIVYALSHEEGDSLKEVIDIADFYGIDLKVIPSYEEIVTAKGRVEVLDGIPIISIRNIPLRLGYNLVLKRIFDILFSLFFIILFSPFYLIIALLVKFTSKGPIFYKQERVGLDNKVFGMLKFRSMIVQTKEKSDTLWTVKDDPRVTVVGSVLRKLSLDETPQFFNVLLGDMSVVGPRPERPFYVEKFRNEHQQYMRRHAAKAGITGWAQVQGFRGDTSIEKRIEADIFYIENWSLLLDIKIILLTPLKAIIDRNAY